MSSNFFGQFPSLNLQKQQLKTREEEEEQNTAKANAFQTARVAKKEEARKECCFEQQKEEREAEETVAETVEEWQKKTEQMAMEEVKANEEAEKKKEKASEKCLCLIQQEERTMKLRKVFVEQKGGRCLKKEMYCSKKRSEMMMNEARRREKGISCTETMKTKEKMKWVMWKMPIFR